MGADRPSPLNILLVTSDQQRADTIGALNPAIRTPHLDRLARGGVIFERGYTVNPVCTPSRVSMLTGQYASRHGCYHVGTGLPEDYRPNVARRLADAGYFTALVGKAHFQPCLDPTSFEAAPRIHDLGFFRRWNGPYYGFDHARLVIGHTSEPHACGMHYGTWLEDRGVDLDRHFGNHPYAAFGRWSLPAEHHGSAWVAEESIAVMDRARREGRPFFLWASFQDPHNPYVVPEPWNAMYEPRDLPPAIAPGDAGDAKPPFYAHLRAGRFYGDDPDLGPSGEGDVRLEPQLGEAGTRATRAAYWGMVSLMDHHIGRILDALEERGLADRTLVVFTSDHGDYLGDHGLWGKGLPAYEEIQRVPFIVRHPACRTPGERSGSLQSVVDLESTFLAAAGLRASVGSQGVDQTHAWLDAGRRVRSWAMLEFHPGEGPYVQRTLVTDRHKLVLYRARPYGELYDLAVDPAQQANLFGAPRAQPLLGELTRLMVDAEMQRDGRRRSRSAFA